MVEPTSFEDLERSINSVLDSEANDFLELCESFCLDPKIDFSGANLSECNLTCLDLRGANFKNTDLRSSNLGREERWLPLSHDLLRDLTQDLVHVEHNLDLTLHRTIGLILTLGSNLSRILDDPTLNGLDLAIASDRANALDRSLNEYVRALGRICSLISVRDLATDLAPALDSNRARDIALNPDRAHDIIRALNRARSSALDLAHARDLARKLIPVDELGLDSDCARDITPDPDLALKLGRACAVSYRIYLLVSNVGADLSGADLSGADLSGANVDGCIMTTCTGLLPNDIEDLKCRGAIFDEFLVGHQGAYPKKSRTSG